MQCAIIAQLFSAQFSRRNSLTPVPPMVQGDRPSSTASSGTGRAPRPEGEVPGQQGLRLRHVRLEAPLLLVDERIEGRPADLSELTGVGTCVLRDGEAIKEQFIKKRRSSTRRRAAKEVAATKKRTTTSRCAIIATARRRTDPILCAILQRPSLPRHPGRLDRRVPP